MAKERMFLFGLEGGGFSFGKSKIDRGAGLFSGVFDVNEIFGNYIAMGGHAGLVSSVEGRAMTKGDVSLLLSGKGRGVDLGGFFVCFFN